MPEKISGTSFLWLWMVLLAFSLKWVEETPCHLVKWCSAPLITTLSTFPSFTLHSSALMHKLVTPSFLPATCNILDSQSFVLSTTSNISLLGSIQSTGLVSLAVEAIDAPSAPVPPIWGMMPHRLNVISELFHQVEISQMIMDIIEIWVILPARSTRRWCGCRSRYFLQSSDTSCWYSRSEGLE